MIRIGLIGIGFMGYTHFEGCGSCAAEVTAIATRNAKRLAGDWRGIQGNFGPPAGQVDLAEIRGFTDYHELLADPEIDLVDICLPTELHEQVTLEALAAGKHVLVEKPISVDRKAAERMVKSAAKNNRMLMVGHVLPYFPEFRFARECIMGGRYGKLLAAHFRRVIAPPQWSKNMADYRKLGGWGVDLHIHDNHFIGLTCGVPKAVFARGIVEDGLVNHVHSQYIYDDPGLAVSCVSGGIAATGLQFAHGFEVYLEKATIVFSAGTFGGEWVVERPLTVIPQKGSLRQPTLKGGSEWCAAFTAELQDAVNGVKTGQMPPILSGDLALNALKLCDAEAKSISTGRVVTL